MKPVSIDLRGGRSVRVRPLAAADAAEVQAFVRRLSPESRRERFFSAVSELSPVSLQRVLSSPGLSAVALHGYDFVGHDDPLLVRMALGLS